MGGELWVEVVFMMVILKIPVVYLCLVVYWAIKSEPRPPLEGAQLPVAPPGPEPCPWSRRRPLRPTPRPRTVPRAACRRARVAA